MPARLQVSAIPFRSSRLAVPPSPFSPLLPIPPNTCAKSYSPQPHADLIEHLPPPVKQPLRWLWVCHVCRRSYSLSVTRRCLDDGHYFCAGTSMVRSRRGSKQRVRKRHAACASEFDYSGWKDWGVWRRNLLTISGARVAEASKHSPCDSMFEDDSDDENLDVDEITASVVSPITPTNFEHTSHWRHHTTPARPQRDCWNNCDYPSECRWGKQFGVSTPQALSFPTLTIANPTPAPSTAEFVDIDMTDAPRTTFNAILTAEQASVAEVVDGVDDTTVAASPPALSDLANLVTRAQRRRSRSEAVSSPLAETESGDGVAGVVRRVTRSGSRESLRRAFEDGMEVIAGLVGWRSSSAPASAERRRQEEEAEEMEGVERVGRERRRSFG